MWPPEDERFENRAAAGRILGEAIAITRLQPDLILALPRGGTPVGFEVAQLLGAEFDLVITQRIGLPWQPDLGVGAIAEDGPAVFDHDALACQGLNVSDLTPAVERERVELRKRQIRYRGTRQLPDVAGKTVIIIDDGLTTGVNARAAIRALRQANPAHLGYAAPVCSAESHDWLAAEADSVVDLHSPRDFPALGLYYRDFAPVTDDDVERLCMTAWGAAKV
jgi:putative phosphoribosyl transferase